MKAQVLYGINDLKYENNYKNPEVKENEVLVQVKACGICGSDVDRVLKNGTYHFPTIIGHEFSGIVKNSDCMEGKKWVGKRVSVFPLIPCRKCPSCLSGNYQLCENYNYLGSRCDGGFAEFVSVPVWNLLEIPEGVTYESAALMEPASVAMHALKISGNVLGRNVLITGAGTITSILIQLVIAGGASKVIVIARNESKLAYLKQIEPSIVVLNSEDVDLYEKIKNEMNGGCIDISIEGTGASAMLEKVLLLTGRKGTVVTMGNPSNDVQLDKKTYWQLLRKELVVKGTWNSSYGLSGKSDWEDMFALLKNKKINLDQLITHKIRLNELLTGIQMMNNKNELYNKIMVVNNEE